MINKKRIVNFSNNKLVNDNKDIILDTTSDDNLLVSSNTHITENININADGNILINNTPKVFPIKPSNVNSGHYLKVNSTGTDLEFDNLSGHLTQTKFTFFNKSFVGNSLANTVNEIPLPFSITIKPNSVNSKILISTAVNYSSTDNGRFYKFLLYRSDDNGSTYNVINESMNDHHNYFKKSFMTSNWGGDTENLHPYFLSNNVNEYLDIANTTNPIIYKLYCHSESGNIDNTRIFNINVPYNNLDNFRPEPTSYIMAQEIFYPNPMTYIKNSINYRTYTFTESSTFTLDKASYCDYLIVAGGGAGAGPNNEGGGGGAGGIVYRENVLFNSGTYNITVGSGGIATNGTTATSGDNSIISNLSSNNQARGGGSGDINKTGGGLDGGSGGGGSQSMHYLFYDNNFKFIWRAGETSTLINQYTVTAVGTTMNVSQDSDGYNYVSPQAGNYFSISDSNARMGTNNKNITVAFAIDYNGSSNTSSRHIFQQDGGGEFHRNHTAILNSNGSMFYDNYRPSGTGLSTSQQIETGKKVVVFTISQTTLTLYDNGTLKGTTSKGNETYSGNNPTAIIIGGSVYNSSAYSFGSDRLYSVAVWDRVLSASDAQSITFDNLTKLSANTNRSDGLKIDGTSADKITYQTSGGIITTYTDNNIFYVVHTFISSGTFTANSTITNVDYLIVAGGGAGSGGQSGSWEGGGAGAGGLIYRTNQTFASGSHSITIGNGGSGSSRGNETNGTDSIITGKDTAKGGGKGARYAGNHGTSGGSGGGGRHNGGDGAAPISHNSETIIQNSTTANQVGVFGNYGGSEGDGNGGNQGGGGGGAGGRGKEEQEGSVAGFGGIGKQYSIRDGTLVYYAGGGGGGKAAANSGGLGGGGDGRTSLSGSGGNAVPNTGGGGGGGFGNNSGNGGNGGSGIVIIRYSATPINFINNIGEFGNDGGCKNFWSSGSQIDISTVGGGGGGAGETGYDGNGTDHTTNSTSVTAGAEELRGKGGDGKIYNIRDGETQLHYGGGGGGARSYGGGVGGKGGGGHGANPEGYEAREGKSATRNTGGGGGGGCNATGGNGGSGIVIIGVRE